MSNRMNEQHYDRICNRKEYLMDIVKSPEFLIRIANDTYGMKLEPIEAEMILGYLEGCDFCLLFEFNYDYNCEILRIHDNQSADECTDEIVYMIAQIMEFCQSCNATILSEQENPRNSPDEYVRELRKDEALLNRLVVAAWLAVPFASAHLLDRIMRRNDQKA